ncbi:family 43 glycosylhydrolase [Chitinophaga sp. S165]|uniref:family 43 glycosylhydrolase n=1 Tax=Chitinophaga sp. S165 TaxID=2135462 RepID=UPI000D888DDF|nr:family 43 glycosylhydrolase [Chitinophaga sp. S165]PWV46130.1 glycosyl hydrolase family 43 [Chitinophaga sp. S165]
MIKSITLSIIAILIFLSAIGQVKNFSASGQQITKFDHAGNAVDAHDGMIAYFNGTYYLYGTSYDCGFEWNNKIAPFCGFKVYSSKDLASWKDEGFLFDAQNPVWQTRCDGKTYGCFRPHVVYNRKYGQYVLWINVYDNVIGYRVFTGKSPLGPFVEVAEPELATNNNMPAAGLNNGDHDLFVDDDGTAYLALTDWRAKGSIVIEQLKDDYLTGTGKITAVITDGQTEAPALFKRNGTYYVTYSDPNCGYCSGTGTSYKSASSVAGPWSPARKISDNSCGGQPSFVSTIKLREDTIFLYGSDLWNNAAKNEALANFYWAPLSFDPDGSIKPMECLKFFRVTNKNTARNEDSSKIFKAVCEIKGQDKKVQSFTADRTGKINRFNLTVLKSGYPDAGLIVDFYDIEGGQHLFLKSYQISTDAIGWSAKNVVLNPGIEIKKNRSYQFVLRTESTTGCFGYAKQVAGYDSNSAPGVRYSYIIE